MEEDFAWAWHQRSLFFVAGAGVSHEPLHLNHNASAVLCINVLIAVVSDSYDYAMFRAHKIFLRTKLQVFAEFDALGLLTATFLGHGFVIDKLVVPCMLLI